MPPFFVLLFKRYDIDGLRDSKLDISYPDVLPCSKFHLMILGSNRYQMKRIITIPRSEKN